MAWILKVFIVDLTNDVSKKRSVLNDNEDCNIYRHVVTVSACIRLNTNYYPSVLLYSVLLSFIELERFLCKGLCFDNSFFFFYLLILF